jgi:hypothetical protein
VVHLILGFTFGVQVYILTFTKLLLYDFFLKKNKFKILNLRNKDIFMVYIDITKYFFVLNCTTIWFELIIQ